jgi:hypothetical protein
MANDPNNDSRSSETAPPLLNYQSAGADVPRARPPRRTVPRPFGIAFFCTASLLALGWLYIEIRNVWLPHVAIYIFGVKAVIGLIVLAFPQRRLVAAGILLAAALWVLMLGTCSYGTGWGVRPMAW